MTKKIKDIKVVRPEDKLIIVVDIGATSLSLANKNLESIAKIAEEFMSMKGRRVLCFTNTLRPYIIKKGAKIALSAIFEQMLDKEENK